MNSTKYLLTAFIFILLVINNIAAQSGRIEKIDQLMNEANRGGVFNGNVLIAEKGKIVYQQSFGFANGAKTARLDADYRFNIGSIAKEFNAVGIMILKERGKLNLDDKVSKFLPELPAWAEKITVKNLLQYASGLPDINWKNVKGDADVLRDLRAAEKLNFEPGAKYAYSNSNTFVQRQIIERISKMSFNRFVEKEMLKPCRMKASIVDPDLRGGKKLAVAFNNQSVEDARQFTYPMSGWTSVTARDLYRWTECLHDEKLIKRQSLFEILEPFAPGNQAGLGGGKQENGRLKEHYHHGSSFDFEALMSSEISTDTTIILLTNNKNSKLFELRDAIGNILAGKPYETPQKTAGK